jgi:hypothetical protein
MTHANNTQQIHPTPLAKRMLHGAAIALVLITVFLVGVDDPNPSWPRFWMVKPLIIVPIAGAMGGVFYYFMDHLRVEGGWKKIAANFLSVLVYIIGLWLGSVVGLDGTLWN